jgi:hypothetical protein
MAASRVHVGAAGAPAPARGHPARLVDLIMVYKVDRLMRSLADFAKLVELFDAHGVSFVAVTQQSNTTMSMGCRHLRAAVAADYGRLGPPCRRAFTIATSGETPPESHTWDFGEAQPPKRRARRPKAVEAVTRQASARKQRTGAMRRRRPLPELEGLKQARTRIVERTRCSGENPKLESIWACCAREIPVRAQPLLSRSAGKEYRLWRAASRMN